MDEELSIPKTSNAFEELENFDYSKDANQSSSKPAIVTDGEKTNSTLNDHNNSPKPESSNGSNWFMSQQTDNLYCKTLYNLCYLI